MKLDWRNVLVILLFAVGCSSDPEPVIKKEEITIFFNAQSKLSVREDIQDEVIIPIKISLSQETPIVVTYETIGQEVVKDSDFVILSDNPLVIPAGSSEASVRIKIIDNDVVQPEDRNIYLRFRSIDQSHVKVAVPKEVVIAIKEDDCAANVSNVNVWIGSLTFQSEGTTSTGTGSENSAGICSGTFNVKGKFVGSENPESTLTIRLTQNLEISTKGSASITRTKLFSFTSQYEVEATGVYDELTKKITLNYSIFDLNNSTNNFSSTMVITTN